MDLLSSSYLLKNSGFVIHKFAPSAGQKNPFAEVLEDAETKAYLFQHFYFVIKLLADTVGFSVFSVVLYVSALVPDDAACSVRIGAPADGQTGGQARNQLESLIHQQKYLSEPQKRRVGI